MRRALLLLAAVALIAVVVIGLTQAGGKSGSNGGAKPRSFNLEQAQQRLKGAPPALAALHAQSSELLSGGRKAFAARLKALRGHPVVVNKWASWCGPCRAEFPIFQSVATDRGRAIAFVGIDGSDKRPAASSFLEQFPIPYPSYEDPGESIARSIGAPQNYPITVFYDARGKKAFVHQGGYSSLAALTADLDRYLG
jgi:thiol-disulfide isomerase/thioredoxin